MSAFKPTLCLDFDGVLHSYTSGWKGARSIPDPPVPGALEFLVGALDRFQVVILSSRSHQWGGRRAMKRWLHRHLREAGANWDHCPQWMRRRIAEFAFADPWEDDVDYFARKIVRSIQWPLHKPSAFVTIDDRALTFTGNWADFTHEKLVGFKPWNK